MGSGLCGLFNPSTLSNVIEGKLSFHPQVRGKIPCISDYIFEFGMLEFLVQGRVDTLDVFCFITFSAPTSFPSGRLDDMSDVGISVYLWVYFCLACA